MRESVQVPLKIHGVMVERKDGAPEPRSTKVYNEPGGRRSSSVVVASPADQ